MNQKRKNKKQKLEEKIDKHQVPASLPKTIPQSEIIRRIAESLGGDYAEYEILDVLEAAGPVFMQALEAYESFRIRGMGEFSFKLHKPRKYYNVANQRFEFTNWTRRPHFEFVREAKRKINESVKQLHVETLQQPADYVLPEEHQLKAYQSYLARLGTWSENKLQKFTNDIMKDITELSKPDELQIAKDKIASYKKNLDARYDRYYNDILQKIATLEQKIKEEKAREVVNYLPVN